MDDYWYQIVPLIFVKLYSFYFISEWSCILFTAQADLMFPLSFILLTGARSGVWSNFWGREEIAKEKGLPVQSK